MIIVGSASRFWMALVAFCCTGIGGGFANVPDLLRIAKTHLHIEHLPRLEDDNSENSNHTRHR